MQSNNHAPNGSFKEIQRRSQKILNSFTMYNIYNKNLLSKILFIGHILQKFVF